MKWLRFLLFPFGIIYWIVTFVRNFFYDKGIFKSYVAPIPIIAVGNLSVGGTGKSPQIEYLIRLLSDKYRIATLSRGYKRKSKGFILADQNTKVENLGDEPFQFFLKFKNINVAVDSDRTNGIQNLLKLENPPEIILLDDAYQHRKVKATAYILLTAYSDLYSDDFILPVGNLRESRNGAKRAKIVIVTKCPTTLSDSEKQKIQNKLSLSQNQKLFFTTIGYDESVFSSDSEKKVSEIKSIEKVILAGIAKPEPFFEFLKHENDIALKYPDHHNFSEKEISEIKQKANGKIIITTEKDYVRIKDKFDDKQLFYLPIKTEFLSDVELFNGLIVDLKDKKIYVNLYNLGLKLNSLKNILMKINPPFNLYKWIEENRHLLKPPVGNKNLYVDSGDYIVMIVGGPNARKDFHYNQTEELFFQLEGTARVFIQENGEKKEMILNAGDMFLLPAGTPHSPKREENSVGLVVESKRVGKNMKDGLMWFCENCNHKLYEVHFELNDIEKDFLPHFEEFYNSEELRTCKNCGETMETDSRFVK